MGKLKSTGIVTVVGILMLLLTLSITVMIGQERLISFFEPVVQREPIHLASTVLLLSLLMSIGLPRQLAAFTCGYFLGWQLGVCIALISATLGCMITITIARLTLYEQVKIAFQEKAQWLQQFFEKDTFLKALIIRLIPAGSNFITNVIAGAVHVPIKSYLVGTFIGFIPQMIVFSLLGNGIQLGESTQIWLSLSMLLVAVVLSMYLMRKSKIGKEIKRHQ